MNKPNHKSQDHAPLIGFFEDIASRENETLKERGADSMMGRMIILQYKKKSGKPLYYDKATGKVCVDYNNLPNGN